MSILQEYEMIRQDMGEEKYSQVLQYVDQHPALLLSDVLYKKSEYESFEKWLDRQKKPQKKIEENER